MNRIKIFAALACAALMTLASCGKEEVAGSKNGSGIASVKIDFSWPEGALSRAEGPAATAGAASFKAGHILFATSSGLISKHVGVGNSAGSRNVTIADLTDGKVVVEDVSSSATKCYIVSNDVAARIGGTGFTGNLEGQNISTLLSAQIAVNNINNAAGDLESVPMYGEGSVVPKTGTVDSKSYTAAVDVAINSLAARIQIGKLTAGVYTPPTGDAISITSFKVDGIFVNYTFDSMTPASVVAAAPQIDNDSTQANYSTGGATDYSVTGTASALADDIARTATSLVVTPAKAYWAYNVFPKGIPHVIVKLSEVKYRVGTGAEVTIPGNQWLTIATYKYASGANAGDPVAAFAANNIYTLGNVAFDYSDMTDVPETKDLDVLVTVRMFEWVDNDVVWGN